MSSCGGPCRRAFLKPFALAAQPCRLRLSGRCPMGRKSVFEPVASDGCMTDSFRRPCIGTKPDEKSQKPYSVKPLPFVSGRSFRSCEAAAGTDAIGGGVFCGPEPAVCPSRRMPFVAEERGRRFAAYSCFSYFVRETGPYPMDAGRVRSGPSTEPFPGGGRGAACRRPGADRRCGTGSRGRSRAVQDRDIFLSSLAVGFPADFNVCRPTF